MRSGIQFFGENDVNKIFNNFHNTFLRIFLLKLSKHENTGPKKKIVFGCQKV